MLYIVVLPPPPSLPDTGKAPVTDKTTKTVVKKVQNVDNEQEYQDIDLTSMRRTIAKRLTQSKVNFKTLFYCSIFILIFVSNAIL